MKKRISAVLLTVLTVCVLTACTKGTTGGSNEQAGASQTQGSGTIASGAETLAGIGTGTGTSSQGTSDGSGAGTDGTASGSGSAVSDGTVSVTGTAETAGNAGTAGTEGNTDANGAVQNEDAETEADSTGAETEENYSDEDYDAVNNGTTSESASEGWSGTYTSESGEILTISIQDAETINFSFTTAGIAKTAELDGNRATYHGDDQHVTVFDYSGNTVVVTVLSEEDFDASDSPLNGTYTRQ
ncbi:MAG: hypothetical protein PHE06_04645 [Lachnospiraceae bacterium]|nr:hypothetical protein [Lachnospiraceae bacterium]MDD3795252.1 hypothetical protein [Lachnospiraceae bacterium]